MRGLMVFPICTLLSVTAASAQGSDQIDCKNAIVQQDMNICADRDFQAADRTLNTTYKAVIARLNGAGRDKLRAEERGWIIRRDKQCTSDAAPESGGSIYPMVYSECLTEKTKSRIKALQGR